MKKAKHGIFVCASGVLSIWLELGLASIKQCLKDLQEPSSNDGIILGAFRSDWIRSKCALVKAIRQHWAIENSLHWVLDVCFGEDQCRVRDKIAVRNFALLRKIAINLINQQKNTQVSIKARRKKAGWNNAYMQQILTGNFHA